MAELFSAYFHNEVARILVRTTNSSKPYTSKSLVGFSSFTEKIMAGVLTNPVIFGAVAVIVGDIVMSRINRYISSITRIKIDMCYRRLIWKRLMKSPIRLFDEVKPSEMVSRAANDTSTLSAVIAGILPSIISMIYSSFLY